MFGKKDKAKEEIKKDLEDERIDLSKIVAENLSDAKEKLDKTLSTDNMEFCSRCGKKVPSRLDWGGKCIQDGCMHLICSSCWAEGKMKCKEHSQNKLVPIKEDEKDKKNQQPENKEDESKNDNKDKRDESEKTGKKEEEKQDEADKEDSRRKKEEAKDEDAQKHEKETGSDDKKDIPNLIRNPRSLSSDIERAAGITNDENVIMGYASDYIEFIKDRFIIYGVPNFSMKGYFEKGKFRKEEKGVFFVYKKWFIFKRPMLRFHVIPFVRYEPPLENHIAGIINGAKKGAYNIFIFVTDTERITKDVEDLVNRFDSITKSVFFFDAGKRKLIRSNDGLDLFYSSWLDPNQKPMTFMELAKIPSEMTGNIAIISVKGFARYLKIDEKKAEKILKGCKLLKRIKGSDSFMFKF